MTTSAERRARLQRGGQRTLNFQQRKARTSIEYDKPQASNNSVASSTMDYDAKAPSSMDDDNDVVMDLGEPNKPKKTATQLPITNFFSN